MERAISFTLNGKPPRVTVDDERMLLWVLRSDLGLAGAKFGCGAALCGACTVILEKEAVRSCYSCRESSSFESAKPDPKRNARQRSVCLAALSIVSHFRMKAAARSKTRSRDLPGW